MEASDSKRSMVALKEVSMDQLVRQLTEDKPWLKDVDLVYEERRDYGNVLVIRYKGRESTVYLRHSKGPRQGFGWDVYGDNMLNPALALLAIIDAPPPVNWRRVEFLLKEHAERGAPVLPKPASRRCCGGRGGLIQAACEVCGETGAVAP